MFLPTGLMNTCKALVLGKLLFCLKRCVYLNRASNRWRWLPCVKSL